MSACFVCASPLSGQQQKYCSERCKWQGVERKTADNRRHRNRYQTDPMFRARHQDISRERARRKAAERIAEMALAGLLRAPYNTTVESWCVTCGVGFLKKKPAKYCGDGCRPKAHRPHGRKTTDRGYGAEHQRRRRELLPLAYGQACDFCQIVMVEGDILDLDHSVPLALGGEHGDRIVHASCNRSAGAAMGNRMRRAA